MCGACRWSVPGTCGVGLMCVLWMYGVSDVCVILFSCCVLMVHVTCEFQVDLPPHVVTLVKFFASLGLNFHI